MGQTGQIASQSQIRTSLLRWILVLVPLVVLLGFLAGRIAGSGDENAWYAALRKPAIMPPSFVFGLAWGVLYVLLGVAVALIANARGAALRGVAVALFVVLLAMNFAWSPLFFGAHQVTVAFWWLIGLIVLGAATAAMFVRVRPLAGALLLPYLAWLCFAALLNWQVHALNPDAERLAPEGPSSQIQL